MNLNADYRHWRTSVEADTNAALLARIEALEARVREREIDIEVLSVALLESKLLGLATSSAMHGLLTAIGWNPYVEYQINQAFEHSFEGLKTFDPTQAEMDTYEGKVATLRRAIANSRKIAESARSNDDDE